MNTCNTCRHYGFKGMKWYCRLKDKILTNIFRQRCTDYVDAYAKELPNAHL